MYYINKINCDLIQQIILKVVIGIKYMTKLLKILLKFPKQNNSLSIILENNLKNREIRKFLSKNSYKHPWYLCVFKEIQRFFLNLKQYFTFFIIISDNRFLSDLHF